jgi:predicted CoA-substrate-specific enzyme activase
MADPQSIGIDVGSTSVKAVVLDSKGTVLASVLQDTQPALAAQGAAIIEGFRKQFAANTLVVAATGYGRRRVTADRVQTEITCHARGAFAQVGRPFLLVDVGGQDTKIIVVGTGGQVTDFRMNDKCAAGTGRFLEVTLQRLRIPMNRVSAFLDSPEPPAEISSTCAVFAESEVVSLVAEEIPLPSIVKGVHAALGKRVAQLAGVAGTGLPVYMSGGVALNPLLVAFLSQALGRPVTILEHPQMVGAVGAGLVGLDGPG